MYDAGWLLLGGALLAILIGAGGMVWRIGVLSQRPKKLPNDEAPDVNADWRSIRFNSGESQIEGWLLMPVGRTHASAGDRHAHAGVHLMSEAGDNPSDSAKDRPPLVIVAHGWGSNRTRVLRYARPLCEAGYAVLLYDARSHGDSDSIKAPSALMFRDDVLAAMEYASRLADIDPERIVVLGHSLGGFGTLLALDAGLKASGIITDAMPVRFETMMRAELKRKKLPLFPLEQLIPSIWLIRAGITREQYRKANIPVILQKHAGSKEAGKTPVLMIHSRGDTFISSEDLTRLERQLAPGTVQTLLVSAEGHSASEQDPAFWEAVMVFLNRTLSGHQKEQYKHMMK